MDPNGEIVEEAEEDNGFRRFDVVSDDSDHHYVKLNRTANSDADCFSNAASGVYSKIMQEWKILEKNLPDSIFVRVYERRIDLLRAVIVGAVGTPYHDGLFAFDLAFPPDYPAHPPQVHYRSFGLRLNPNLYANGRVCLSLLNTWVGRKKEKWDPSQSTVLQVLVSLQGLVLNEKPYFNEPGHGVLPGRTLIAAHFRDRALFILEACNAYTDGRVKVGYYRGDGSSSSSSSSSTVHVSHTFKTSMQKVFPDLVHTFTRNGASLGNFVEQVKQDRKKASSQTQAAVHKKQGIAIKFISKLKMILGLKKSRKSNGVVGSTANNRTEIEG
ncbi:putative ubiquitin-conjugating enzyme E2 39 [Vitis vinifera]|uniref:Putative ubiquitin-conjugating enzyme E2 39 n=1 Tax=Vitis vinifera TaxID=29760 RepID=A0A438GAZ7_VITVI|nr:putative ubiquitin-conjugating enzyme E2 39 [Vitis vinifera]